MAIPLVSNYGASASSTADASASGQFTAAQVLAGVKKNSTAANKVNSKPHINTMTRAMNVNVYQVATGVYAYGSPGTFPSNTFVTRWNLTSAINPSRRWPRSS